MTDEMLHFIGAVFVVAGFALAIRAEDKAWKAALEKVSAECDAAMLTAELREATNRIAELTAQIEAHDCGVADVVELAKRRHPSGWTS
jgi:hypothetical protein